jgi:hypothetical protein
MPDSASHSPPPMMERTRASIARSDRLLAATALLLSSSVQLARARFTTCLPFVQSYEPWTPEPPILLPIGQPLDGLPTLAGSVRAMLTRGELAPLRSGAAWAGMGSGAACCVCSKMVSRSEVDQDGRRLAGCHCGCFGVWQEESRRFVRPAD